jgi:hypothetical protein
MKKFRNAKQPASRYFINGSDSELLCYSGPMLADGASYIPWPIQLSSPNISDDARFDRTSSSWKSIPGCRSSYRKSITTRRIASTKQDYLLPHVEDRCFCESLSATQPQSQSDSRIERCTCVSKHFRLAQSALTEPLTNLTSCSTEATSVSARKNRPKGSVTGLGIHRSR